MLLVNKKTSRGFTIVELLIVIVVIAILASISIVAYRGVQDRAHDTVIKGDLSKIAKNIELYNAEHGAYPQQANFFLSELQDMIRVSKESYDPSVYNYYYCVDKNQHDKFGVAARSKSGQTFTISSDAGIDKTSLIPSWRAACGAFGVNQIDKIEFSYGYNLSDRSWKPGIK